MGRLMNVDPEMLELFRAEMDAHLPVLSGGLLALEKGGVTAQQIEAMMRAAHSIKGAARIVGIEPAVRLSHMMEDCFTAAKESRISLNSGSVDVLLEGLDALQRVCASQESEGLSEESLQAILEKMTGIRDASPAGPVAAVKCAAPAPSFSGELVAATVDCDEPSITLPAAWDDQSVTTLRCQMLDTLALHPWKICLDFTHVERLSARALAVLVSFSREAARSSPPPRVQASEVSVAVQALLRAGGLQGDLGLSAPA